MKLLEGERALVTGSAHGIGRGMVAALKEEGAQVLGADIADADVQCDLSSAEAARRLAADAIARLAACRSSCIARARADRKTKPYWK